MVHNSPVPTIIRSCHGDNLFLLRDVAGAKARCANPPQSKNLLVRVSCILFFLVLKKLLQVRKLTASEMTCDVTNHGDNHLQPSNIGLRLKPSKSQVDPLLVAPPLKSPIFSGCV